MKTYFSWRALFIYSTLWLNIKHSVRGYNVKYAKNSFADKNKTVPQLGFRTGAYAQMDVLFTWGSQPKVLYVYIDRMLRECGFTFISVYISAMADMDLLYLCKFGTSLREIITLVSCIRKFCGYCCVLGSDGV